MTQFDEREIVGGDKALVGIVIGSSSDWPEIGFASETLLALGIAHERFVISAHRTPDRCADYAQSAKARNSRDYRGRRNGSTSSRSPRREH